ncbi:DUF7521 family protein [Haloarcula laminariae]|uniref:DUF7521 family protein n=1 Tax=Haloarcula laminariae TaxID=2961577 RepID=UPI0021C6B8FC|nr:MULTISPECIES: hypothetical protein [Halomicroarcula]
MHPAQVDPSVIPPHYLLLLVATLVAAGMGLFIVYQAYQGYRRSDRKQMLFLAIGLALITVASPMVSLVISAAALQFRLELIVYTFYSPFVSNIIKIVGIGFIIYSLSLQSDS